MANQTEIVGVLKLKGGDQFVRDVNKKLDGVRKSFLSLNNVISATLITIFAKKMLDAANQSEQASAKIKQAIESTGGAAGVTAQELENMAGALQQVGIYEDDAIKEAQALLLTFTRISRDVFPKTVEIILDVSAALGQDLKSSAVQVGKALNDPIVGVDALRRVGVQFTDAQQEQIKALVKSNDLLGAQKMILAELQVEFGGMNKALGETTTGNMIRFNNSLDDFMEIGGELLQRVLKPMLNVVNPLFQQLNDGLKTFREQVNELEADQVRKALHEMVKEFGLISGMAASPLLSGGPFAGLGGMALGQRQKQLLDNIKLAQERLKELASPTKPGGRAGAGGGAPIIPGLPTPEETEAAFDFNRRAQDHITHEFIKGGFDRTKANAEIMQKMVDDARRLAAEEEAIIRERNQRILDQAMFIRDAVANIGISIADSFRTGENKLKAALKQILLTVLDAIDRYIILAKIKSLLDAVINPFATLKNIAPLAIASGLLQVVKSQIAAMAEGGLVTRPTLALVGEAGPEVVAPQQNFVDFANQLLGGDRGRHGGSGVNIIQNFNTPLNDRRQARFLTDTVLKPTIRREQRRRGRTLNRKVID